MAEQLHAEDEKLITLAKGARARVGSIAGACVRDQDGRTYSGASVELVGKEFSALQIAIATAVGNGAAQLEAVCVLGNDPSAEDSEIVLHYLMDGGKFIQCTKLGGVHTVITK